MLTTLNQTALQADGRYLNDQELQGVEHYIQTFAARHQAYEILSAKADELVISSLKGLAQTHRSEVESYGAKCKRDMAYALKYIARAVLMDESEVFKQDFSLWMENITRAVHKSNSAARAYSCLKVEIQATMPSKCAAVIVPYLDDLITAFSGQ